MNNSNNKISINNDDAENTFLIYSQNQLYEHQHNNKIYDTINTSYWEKIPKSVYPTLTTKPSLMTRYAMVYW